ncbi:Rrf2 family transcriptional regulator [bacterium]|nr:Rrf2 family transcriptional regulator [bacterium]
MPRALNISEAAAMALHTMVALAGTESALTSRELAARLTRSEAHMSKVLQRLVKAGYVTSIRGPHGGFMLSRPAVEICMLDIYEAIDGKVGDVACTQTPPVCDGVSCVFGRLVSLINRHVREYLGAIRLDELTLIAPGQLVRNGPPIVLSKECSCGGNCACSDRKKGASGGKAEKIKRIAAAMRVPE